MKKKKIFLGLALITSFILVSCDNNTNQTKDRGKEEKIEDVKIPDVFNVANVSYTVKHLIEDENGLYNTISVETINAKSGEMTNAIAKNYNGYSPLEFSQKEIELDGSTVIEIKYKLNKYTISFDGNSIGGSVAGEGEYSILDGNARLIAKPYIGYEFDGWYLGDTKLSNSLNYSLEITDNMNIIGKFVIKNEFKDFEFDSSIDECIIYDTLNPNIKELNIPYGVTEVASNAFRDIRSKYINLPSSLRSIGMNAFTDNDALLRLTINSNIKLGIGAFSNDSYVIPEVYDLGNNDLSNNYSFLNSVIHNDLSAESIFIESDDFLIKEENIAGNPYYVIYDYLGNDTDIILPDKLNIDNNLIDSYVVGPYAFYYNKSIKTLTVSSSVESILGSAFYGCDNLLEVYDFSSLAISIGDFENGFAGYYALIIHDKEEEKRILSNDKYDYYIDDLGNAIICKYKLDNKNVIISQIENYPTIIGTGLFNDNLDIETLTILDGVTKIESYAFANCKNLKYVDCKYVKEISSYAFTNSLIKDLDIENCETIEESAFIYCYALKNIKMDKVRSIGSYAFNSCFSLYQITLPNTLNNIGSYAFYDTNIVEVINKSNINVESNSDNGYVGYYAKSIINKENDSILINDNGYIKYLDNNKYMLASYIGNSKELEIPNDINIISSYAISYMELDSLIIKSNVESINEYAFYKSSFNNLNINLTDTILSESRNLNYFVDSNYDTNTNIVTLIINGEIESIPRQYFYDFSIKNIKLPSSIKSIGYYAFRTNEVEELYYDLDFDSWLDISYDYGASFFGSYKSPKLYLKNEDGDVLFDGIKYKLLDTLVVKNNETGIIDDNKYDYYNFKKVIIEEGITEIGRYAFYYCKDLTEVILPSTIKYIGDYAFNKCSNLKIINLPLNLESIGNYAFSETGIQVLNLNSNLSYVGSSSFKGCYNLISVSINYDGEISNSLFSECTNLQSVKINGQIESIGSYAFESCKILRKINLPESINYIDYSAFSSAGLVSIDLSNTSITEIKYCTFYNCKNLTNIQLPINLESIGNSAFYKTALSNINLPDSINSLGNSIFSGCNKLVSVKLPENILTIPSYTFEDCYNLEEVNIPDGVISIGMNAFNNCNKLNYNEYENGLYLGSLDNDYKYFVNIKDREANTLTINPNCEIYIDYLFSYVTIKKIIIPSNVLNIPKKLFYNSRIEEIELPFTGDGVSDFSLYLIFGDKVNQIPQTLKKVTLNNGTTVGKRAFYNCSNIEEVILPDTIQVIDEYAFSGSGIKEIVIGKNIKSICNCAFQACYNLESIDLSNMDMSDSNYSLGGSIFFSATKLSNVILPKNIEIITDSMFYNTALTEFNIPSTVTEIKSNALGNTKLQELTINENVNIIKDYAFSEINTLTKVTINSSTISLGTNLFNNCANLSDVTLSEGMTSIPDSMFFNCVSLKNINLPESVKTINKYAFYSSGIQSIVIGKNITSISDNAFKECKTLYDVCNLSNLNIVAGSDTYGYVGYYAKSIHTDPNDRAVFLDIDNKYRFLIDNGIVALIEYVGDKTAVDDLILPESFTYNDVLYDSYSIDDDVFKGLTFYKNLTIPSSVYKIGDNAFMNSGIVNLTFLGDYIESIGKNAFYNSLKIKSLELPASTYLDSAFYNLTSLTTVTFKDSINETIIGSNMFYNCKNLNSITLPSNLKSIGETAFYNTKLESIVIPDSVETIGKEAFYYSKLNSITISDTSNLSEIGEKAFYYTDIESINLPYGLLKIGEKAFYGSRLISIIIPKTVTTISSYAFSNISYLTDVTINSAILGEYMFSSCSSLNKVVLADSITKIPSNTFAYCIFLKEINMPINLTTIEFQAFYRTGITDLVIPQTVTKIGNEAFKESSLESIEILGNLTSLGDKTFMSSTNLKSVKLPNTITSFGTYTFYGCTSLESVNLPDNLKTMGDYTFYNCKKLEEVVLPTNMTSLGQYAFQNCESLKGIEFPSKITSIPYYSFSGCISLKNITIPENVTYINEGAFYGCASLEDVIVEEKSNNKTISFGDRLFQNCTSLKNVYIYANVSYGTIYSYMFYGCQSLENVILSNTITKIEAGAFQNCTNLASIYYLANAEYNITVGTNNQSYTSANKYYYSETEPQVSGNYWHFDNDGNIVLW